MKPFSSYLSDSKDPARMNSFDATIEALLIRPDFGPTATRIISAVADLYTVKGMVLVPILLWIWFQPAVRREWRREIVIATFVSGVLSLALGRTLADLLPFRTRPVYDPNLHLHFPGGVSQDAALALWSSFPSDHAMLWSAVAAGIFIVWRLVGLLAFVYIAIVICFPRAYLGYHFPTDLLAGAAIGIIITYVITREVIRKRYAPQLLRWIERYPGPSAAVGFTVCIELVTQFDELRKIASFTSKVL
jgi:membrane-associated phospholipid phosphatase